MKNKKQIYGNLFRMIGIILICLALCLTIYNLIEDYLAGMKSNKVIDEMSDVMSVEKKTNNYIANPKAEMSTIEVDNNKYIGILTIESIGIRLPVLSEYDFNKLKIAPARYKGSAYLSNFIIVAHSYISHFGSIAKLEIGDKVKFEDVNGNIFEYEVVKKETIEETETNKLEEENCDLTLFSCKTTNNKYRTIIRLKKIAFY